MFKLGWKGIIHSLSHSHTHAHKWWTDEAMHCNGNSQYAHLLQLGRHEAGSCLHGSRILQDWFSCSQTLTERIDNHCLLLKSRAPMRSAMLLRYFCLPATMAGRLSKFTWHSKKNQTYIWQVLEKLAQTLTFSQTVSSNLPAAFEAFRLMLWPFSEGSVNDNSYSICRGRTLFVVKSFRNVK